MYPDERDLLQQAHSQIGVMLSHAAPALSDYDHARELLERARDEASSRIHARDELPEGLDASVFDNLPPTHRNDHG